MFDVRCWMFVFPPPPPCEPTMHDGIIFDIQRGAMHDGPGIRTTLFLKGCPLRCLWCHNPESMSPKPQYAAPVRPDDPPQLYGYTTTPEKLLPLICKDRAWYDATGGGITLSGGEPAFQPRFTEALLRAARAENIHTCLDTSGHAPPPVYERLAPHVNLFLWDYKATDTPAAPDTHRRLTGHPATLILQNLKTLHDTGALILLRCPLIPGVNDTPAHLEAIARLAATHPRLTGIEILPWHPTGLGKYDRLGLPRPPILPPVPDEKTKNAWLATLQSRCSLPVSLH
ncbi:radical SAM protein [Geminisphaera colitermitum]|uniref:radical SAM protein n=1 Tax=Geminisphaera colitermitum TaxID=1148786 RepID=UPI0009DF2D2F|nr:radical SAM protein [Geminisphaera colitermitum]